jgi:hypothetical protein
LPTGPSNSSPISRLPHGPQDRIPQNSKLQRLTESTVCLAVRIRCTAPGNPGICLPGPTSLQCIPCRSCRRARRRCSPEATPEPSNRASRRQACGTYRKTASIQPSMARLSLPCIPVLLASIHPSALSHLPSWALLFSSLATDSGTARPRMAVDRACRSDGALACESSGGALSSTSSLPLQVGHFPVPPHLLH